MGVSLEVSNISGVSWKHTTSVTMTGRIKVLVNVEGFLMIPLLLWCCNNDFPFGNYMFPRGTEVSLACV